MVGINTKLTVRYIPCGKLFDGSLDDATHKACYYVADIVVSAALTSTPARCFSCQEVTFGADPPALFVLVDIEQENIPRKQIGSVACSACAELTQEARNERVIETIRDIAGDFEVVSVQPLNPTTVH